MRLNLTPWARGALTAEQREILKWHLAQKKTLQVTGGESGHVFTIRLIDPAGPPIELYEVPRRDLWATIVGALALGGVPVTISDTVEE